MDTYIVHFDGSCGPKNPGGTAAFAYTIHKNGLPLVNGREVVGTGSAMSNNLAEFSGLDAALQRCLTLATAGDLINVRGDSQLVINIMNRRWKAKADKLYYPAYVIADFRLRCLRGARVCVNLDWIPREQNMEADILSKWDNLSQSGA